MPGFIRRLLTRRGRKTLPYAVSCAAGAWILLVSGLDILAEAGLDLRPAVAVVRDSVFPVDEAQAMGSRPREGGQASGRIPYNRDDYGGWADADGDCLNTRAEVLIATSTGPVHLRNSRCSVDRGRWLDPYTGKTFTNAADVDIDHLVPLAWAHARGAAEWPSERKIAFANWEPNLFPVMNSVNREKGAAGPIEWLPPRLEYRCEYILRFERVVKTWDLRFSRSEQKGMEEIKAHWCPAR